MPVYLKVNVNLRRENWPWIWPLELPGYFCPFSSPCPSSKNKSWLLIICLCQREQQQQTVKFCLLLQERAWGTYSKELSPCTSKGAGWQWHSCLPSPYSRLLWYKSHRRHLNQVQDGRQQSLPQVTIFALSLVPWLSLPPSLKLNPAGFSPKPPERNYLAQRLPSRPCILYLARRNIYLALSSVLLL